MRIRESLLEALVKRVAANNQIVDTLALDSLLVAVAPLVGLEREVEEALQKDGLTSNDLLRFLIPKEQDVLPLEAQMAS